MGAVRNTHFMGEVGRYDIALHAPRAFVAFGLRLFLTLAIEARLEVLHV